MLLRISTIVFACLLLSGCAAFKDSADKLPTPRGAVYSLNGAYNVAGTIAATYVELPRCPKAGKPVNPICSKQSIVDDIRKADKMAFDAMKAAQAIARVKTADSTSMERARALAFEAIGALKYVLNSNDIK